MKVIHYEAEFFVSEFVISGVDCTYVLCTHYSNFSRMIAATLR